jgi:hypothetical protein
MKTLFTCIMLFCISVAAYANQTLTLDVHNTYCYRNSATGAYTLVGTWHNSITGCTAYGSTTAGATSGTICSLYWNGIPDLEKGQCKTGICCCQWDTVPANTIQASTDCLSASPIFHTYISCD